MRAAARALAHAQRRRRSSGPGGRPTRESQRRQDAPADGATAPAVSDPAAARTFWENARLMAEEEAAAGAAIRRRIVGLPAWHAWQLFVACLPAAAVWAAVSAGRTDRLAAEAKASREERAAGTATTPPAPPPPPATGPPAPALAALEARLAAVEARVGAVAAASASDAARQPPGPPAEPASPASVLAIARRWAGATGGWVAGCVRRRPDREDDGAAGG